MERKYDRLVDLEYTRSFRIYDIAIFDIVLTLIALIIIAPLLTWFFKKIRLYVPERTRFLRALPIALLVHYALGVETTLTTQFLDPNGFYVVKAVVGVLVIAGFIGIHPIKGPLST